MSYKAQNSLKNALNLSICQERVTEFTINLLLTDNELKMFEIQIRLPFFFSASVQDLLKHSGCLRLYVSRITMFLFTYSFTALF